MAQILNNEISELLNEKADLYNRYSFIETDPIQVPKTFSQKENIEISAFLTATIAWGQRPTIIKNAKKMMALMNSDPFGFVLNFSDPDLAVFDEFKHRTYNGDDAKFFVRSLKNIYRNHGGLEAVFQDGYDRDGLIKSALEYFYKVFFETESLKRSRKHISNVATGSAAKRLNMFLRWMVRHDAKGVDFGIWKNIPMRSLMLPLDVHTGNISRKLGLLTRKQNDWRAVEEVTSKLRMLDPDDPIKFDFALFGLGAFENF